MSIILTEEQSMIRDMVAKYLADSYSFEARQKAIASGAEWRPEIWQELAELGLLGAALPEEFGGLGGGAIEHMIIMEELGEAMALEPYLETAVIGGGLLKHVHPDRQAELAEGIIGGTTTIGFAYAEPRGRYNLAALETTAKAEDGGFLLEGFKAAVIGAPIATHLIVSARTAGGKRDHDGVSLFLVPAVTVGISRRDYRLVDARAASDVTFDNVRLDNTALIGRLDQGLPILEEVVDRAIVAICAEALGVMRRLVTDTVAYTKERKQYGQTIAQFQAVKHRMVDMLIEQQEAISMTYQATLGLDLPPEDRARLVSAAKVDVGKACRFVSQNAVQLHGGIGTMDELNISHYFKRAMLIENKFGSVSHHLKRFASLTPAAAAATAQVQAA